MALQQHRAQKNGRGKLDDGKKNAVQRRDGAGDQSSWGRPVETGVQRS